MKIDVEGFEGAVLNGAWRLICCSVVRFIVVEFSNDICESRDSCFVVPGAPGLSLDGSFPGLPLNSDLLFTLMDVSRQPAYMDVEGSLRGVGTVGASCTAKKSTT